MTHQWAKLLLFVTSCALLVAHVTGQEPGAVTLTPAVVVAGSPELIRVAAPAEAQQGDVYSASFPAVPHVVRIL